ncbi:phospholipase [Schaalia vaccimaxillae]|uniref:phospholipase n=1 Tax=Schaalia vaccimaxillae TaxID=183916 RepID=UPI0003B48124
MLRILLALVWIAVTVYAIADWLRTSEEDTPARLNRQMWMLMIILTIPMYSLGSIAWIVLKIIARAEENGSAATGGGLFRRPNRPASQTPVAPDDDPDFLFKLERDLQRKRREEEARKDSQTVEASSVQEFFGEDEQNLEDDTQDPEFEDCLPDGSGAARADDTNETDVFDDSGDDASENGSNSNTPN